MPGKVTKPLFLLRNSVSVFQLGIGAQRAKILTTNLQTRPGSDHGQVAPQATQLDRTLLDLSPPQPLFSRRVGRLEDFCEVRPSGFPCCRAVLGSHPVWATELQVCCREQGRGRPSSCPGFLCLSLRDFYSEKTLTFGGLERVPLVHCNPAASNLVSLMECTPGPL